MVSLWSYVKKYKKLLFLALFLAAINQIFSLLDPQIFRLIIDNYATKAGELESDVFVKGVFLLLLAFVGVAFVSRVAKNFQDYFVSSITQRVGTDMYASSVNHTFSLPFGVFEDRRSGEILQKLQKARTDSQAVIASSINTVFLSLVGMSFVIVYAFIVHWSIGLTFGLLIPLLGGLMFVLSRKIKTAQRKIVVESAELAGSTTETLRNVELVKSLGLESQEIKRLNNVNSSILGLELKKIKLIRVISFVQGTMINGVRAGIMFLMLWLLFGGVISLGEFMTLLFYSFFVFAPLGEFATVVSQFQEAKASNEQLAEILSLEPEAKPKNPKVVDRVESVEFSKVSFSYNSRRKASVNNFSVKIRAGETVAFVGPSGSGKTTLLKLFLGLYKPSSGSLRFNNVDSKGLDFDSLRSRIGLVAQETQLFAGSVRDNLLFVKPGATDEECLQALRDAQVSHVLDAKLGLSTKIGEGGVKLSGGERQRLAIARALLRNPQILVFDEATSSLDSFTEKEITGTIKNIAKSRPGLITLLVAHRLSTVVHADKICVLSKGGLVESGNHKSLIRKRGLYKSLWHEQTASD